MTCPTCPVTVFPIGIRYAAAIDGAAALDTLGRRRLWHTAWAARDALCTLVHEFRRA